MVSVLPQAGLTLCYVRIPVDQPVPEENNTAVLPFQQSDHHRIG